LLDALSAAIAATLSSENSAGLEAALMLARHGQEVCGEHANLAQLHTLWEITRLCADQIRRLPEPSRPALSGVRRALSALFAQLDERIAAGD
jgi:hypothetical protein